MKTDDILAGIVKQYGKIAFSGKELIERPRIIVPLSPAADIPLGGGVPEGSWFLFCAPPKFGKTTTILHFCAKAQALGKTIYFMNIEGRLKEMNLTCIDGLDVSPDKFIVFESIEDKILAAQDYLSIAETIIYSHPGAVIVFDSFSSLADQRELDGGVGTETRGGGAKLLSQFCRNLATVVPVKKTIVVGVVHIMANTSGFGAPIGEKGGYALKFQVDVKLKGKKSTDWVVGEQLVGQKITWVAETNAMGATPYQEFESWMRYGGGIDDMSEAIEMASALQLIEKSGTWLNYTKKDGSVIKLQGVEKFRKYLIENPDVQKDLLGKLKEYTK